MSNEPEKHDDEESSTQDEISQDALGDTYLGKNLRHLIDEIGRQHKRIEDGTSAAEIAGSGTQDSDTADRMERLNEALELVEPHKDVRNMSTVAERFQGDEGTEFPTDKGQISGEVVPAVPAVDAGGDTASGDDAASKSGDVGDHMSQALSEIETTLRRFAAAERRRHEQEIGEWKGKFKKAAMVVIKKQVEIARSNWIKRANEREAKVAEHYRKLKMLADKVAKQKVEIQKAKQELKEKLELADQLHNEFDGIRKVLDGKLGALDALDKDDESA